MSERMRCGGHSVTHFYFNGSSPLSSSLVTQIEMACDLLAGREAGAIAFMRISGEHERGAMEPWPGGADLRLVRKWEQALRRLERLDTITIAAAEHICGGAALELLLTADYRIGTDNLRIAVPTISGQVWPGMALYRLVNQLGLARTRRTTLFGLNMTVVEAAEFGLIDVIASDTSIALETVLESIPPGLRPNMAVCRGLMAEAGRMSYETALGPHLAACDRALRQITPELDVAHLPDAKVLAGHPAGPAR